MLSVYFVCRLLIIFGLTLCSLLELFHLCYAPFNCFPSCAFLACQKRPAVEQACHCPCVCLSVCDLVLAAICTVSILSLSVLYVIGRRCSKRTDRDVHHRVLVRYGQSLSAGIITSPLAGSQSAFCAFEMRHTNDIHCSVTINVIVTETAQWTAGSNPDTVMCPKYLNAKRGRVLAKRRSFGELHCQRPNPTATLRNT